jgi:hypothetical protein
MHQLGKISAALGFVVAVLAFVPQASAARGGGSGGGMEIGFGGGIISSNQDQMNTLITRANSRAGGISTPAMNSAYEVSTHFGYRFSGTMFAVLLRPTYFYQNSTGSGNSGSFNYSLQGFTVFPILRVIPLENDIMKFFLQIGLGYGRATGKIEEAGASAEFVGDSFGTQAGMGAEFCFTGAHCVSIEGNYRYLNNTRNIATSASGTWDSSATNPSLSQAAPNREMELDNDDLQTKMGGLQFLVNYAMHF